MLGYVVPKSVYPEGYHCNPETSVAFYEYRFTEEFYCFYHMGIYANKELLDWFVAEYPKHVKTKLDMAKSCVRFKNMEQIPCELIAELVKKITAKQWIALYEKNIKP